MSTDLSAMTLRMMLAEIAPRKAAALWGTPEVISVMNKHFADAILAAKAEERQGCLEVAEDNRYRFDPHDYEARGWNSASGVIAAAIRKRGDPKP